MPSVFKVILGAKLISRFLEQMLEVLPISKLYLSPSRDGGGGTTGEPEPVDPCWTLFGDAVAPFVFKALLLHMHPFIVFLLWLPPPPPSLPKQ